MRPDPALADRVTDQPLGMRFGHPAAPLAPVTDWIDPGICRDANADVPGQEADRGGDVR